VTINILHDKAVYDLNYTPHMKAHAEAEEEYKLIHTAKHHHAQHNLKNFRLLVLAFLVNHHHTYPISRAIQRAYTSTWH
jgi:hypothetical protein